MTCPPVQTANSIYSNMDNELDDDVAEFLKAHPNRFCAHHAAWDFSGNIWWDGTQWWEEVWQYKVVVATCSSPELLTLIHHVNDEFGWK